MVAANNAPLTAAPTFSRRANLFPPCPPRPPSAVAVVSLHAPSAFAMVSLHARRHSIHYLHRRRHRQSIRRHASLHRSFSLAADVLKHAGNFPAALSIVSFPPGFLNGTKTATLFAPPPNSMIYPCGSRRYYESWQLQISPAYFSPREMRRLRKKFHLPTLNPDIKLVVTGSASGDKVWIDEVEVSLIPVFFDRFLIVYSTLALFKLAPPTPPPSNSVNSTVNPNPTSTTTILMKNIWYYISAGGTFIALIFRGFLIELGTVMLKTVTDCTSRFISRLMDSLSDHIQGAIRHISANLLKRIRGDDDSADDASGGLLSGTVITTIAIALFLTADM